MSVGKTSVYQLAKLLSRKEGKQLSTVTIYINTRKLTRKVKAGIILTERKKTVGPKQFF